MKKLNLITTLGLIASIVTVGSIFISGCGGGGGGGGGPTKQTTNLYLFGTMSSGGVINGVTTTVNIPNFKDYTTASTTTADSRDLRSGVLALSAKGTFSKAKYDTIGKTLTITMTFNNLSSSTTANAGKGTNIATLTTSLGTTFVTPDITPLVSQYRASIFSVDSLSGCKVYYEP